MTKLTLSLALSLALAAPAANAWTLIPGMSLGARMVSHLVLGAVVGEYAEQRARNGLVASAAGGIGVQTATAAGVLKEASDHRFSVPGMLAWPIGHIAYQWHKTRHDCFSTDAGDIDLLRPDYVPCIPRANEPFDLAATITEAVDQVLDTPTTLLRTLVPGQAIPD